MAFVSYFSIFVGIVLAIFMNMYPEHTAVKKELNTQPVTPTRSNTNKTKSNKKENGLVKEAKEVLVSMGFSATEAKDILRSIDANTVEEYIQKALNKVEIE